MSTKSTSFFSCCCNNNSPLEYHQRRPQLTPGQSTSNLIDIRYSPQSQKIDQISTETLYATSNQLKTSKKEEDASKKKVSKRFTFSKSHIEGIDKVWESNIKRKPKHAAQSTDSVSPVFINIGNEE